MFDRFTCGAVRIIYPVIPWWLYTDARAAIARQRIGAMRKSIDVVRRLVILFLACVLLCHLALPRLDAATYVSQLYTVQTKVESDPEDVKISSTGFISSAQDLNYNASNTGEIHSTADQFIQGQPAGPDSFSLTGSAFASVGANTPDIASTRSGPIEASASVEYTITFDLAASETKWANFLCDYTIVIANPQQNQIDITWGLVGPSGAIPGISGTSSFTSLMTAFSQSSGTQSAFLNEAGTYTLTLTGNMPAQDFNNQNRVVDLQFDSVYFEVVQVPEPHQFVFLMVACIGVMMVRRRMTF